MIPGAIVCVCGNVRPCVCIWLCVFSHSVAKHSAAAYEFLGNSEKAIVDCNESLRLDPNYAKAFSRLGLSYFSLGCYKDAVESYRRAVELDKGNAAYRESLNKAELKLAQHPDAPTFATRGAKSAAAPSVPAAAAGGMPQMPGMPPGMPPMDPEAMKGMMNEMGGLGTSCAPCNVHACVRGWCVSCVREVCACVSVRVTECGVSDSAPLGNIMSNPAFLGMAQKMYIPTLR